MRMRAFSRRWALAAGALIASTGAASAQTSGDVIFNGSLLDICVVLVTDSGTITPNGDYTELSSENAGGDRGGATITTTSANFDLVVDAPAAFSSAPSGGDAGVTFDALVTASGVTVLTDIVDGVLSSLGLGLTTLQVGVTASKGAGVFPAGAYQVPVTVRCVAS
jgi:hypothetical protein